MRKELPLMRPMMPPAKPKDSDTTRKAPPAMARSAQRPHRPEEADDGDDHGDHHGDPRDDADDDLEEEPGGDGQDEDREDACADGGARIFHAADGTPPAGSRGSVVEPREVRVAGVPPGRGAAVELHAREAVAADLRG